MRLLAKVSYQGHNYQGWQKQIDAPTVEETIEKVLSQIFATPISIHGSGRTDAGVHAKGQRFHFDIPKPFPIDRLQYSMNCLLPNDIYIETLEEVSDDFHARYSAKGKIYEYDILFGHRDVFSYQTETNIPQPTDISLFKEALQLFVGQHNFQNFTSKEEDENNFVREIYEITTEEVDSHMRIILKGNGFMRYMIRFIIGTSLAVAQNKESLSFIKEHLDGDGKRDIVCYKAPSEGLYLIDVMY